MLEYKGYKIEVSGNGRFIATVGDVQIDAETYREIQGTIDTEISSGKSKRKLSLKVVGPACVRLGRYNEKRPQATVHAVLVGVNRTTRDLQFSGLSDKTALDWCIPDTPENTKLVDDFIAAGEALEVLKEKRDARMVELSGYGRIAAADYESKLVDLENAYGRALANARGAK